MQAAAPRSGWRRRHEFMGVVYAIPTITFVSMFFLTPLVSVARMSLSSWPLLTGYRGLRRHLE